MVVVRSNVRREGGYATPAASRQGWCRKSVRAQAEGGPRALAARRCLEMGGAATSARGSSRRGATVSIGAAATTPAELDMMHFGPWLEWPHSVAEPSPCGTTPDTAAEAGWVIVENTKCMAGARINAIAKMMLVNRRVMAANIAIRYALIENSIFCPWTSLIPPRDSM